MLIAEVRLYGIGNFAEETVIELAPETFFCGSADARKTFRRAMKLLFGNTSPAPQDFSATEMRISAKLTFPETDSAEIPEFFHHMRAEDDGEICAVLELSAKAADGEIETQHSWLLPHDIRRQVKSDEAPAVKFIRIAPDGMTLKEAFLRILPDILLMDEKIELPAFPEIASLIESAKHLPADCTKWLLDGIGMIAGVGFVRYSSKISDTASAKFSVIKITVYSLAINAFSASSASSPFLTGTGSSPSTLNAEILS